MGNLKNTIPKHILKKKTKKTINLDHNYKKKQKSMRERESTHSFFVGKIWIEWEKWHRIYTKSNGEKKSQILKNENEEGSVTLK